MRNRLLFLTAFFALAGALVYFVFSWNSGSSTNLVKKDKTSTLKKVNKVKIQEAKLTEENSLKLASVKKTEKVKKSKINKLKAAEELKFVDEKNIEDEDYFNSEKEKKEAKELVSERERRIEGDKSDHPDLFAQYERDIRTREGRNAPDYPLNYKIEQILKTRNLQSTRSLNKLDKSQALNWMERGPGNVSGRTRGIIVDPDDATNNTWFVGAVSGGVWKTTNAGASWTNLTPDITNLATSTIAMAASNHNVIYAGTGEGFYNVDEIDGTGIWKSTDKGASWAQLASTANNKLMQNITRLIIDPSDENTLLVSANGGFNYVSSSSRANSGIFRSTDGGTSWNMVYDAGTNRVQDLISNPENFNTQYATVNSQGVVKSLDGGLTWSDASNGIGSCSTYGNCYGSYRHFNFILYCRRRFKRVNFICF